MRRFFPDKIYACVMDVPERKIYVIKYEEQSAEGVPDRNSTYIRDWIKAKVKLLFQR
jgi:hypothetical protein